MVFPCGAEFWTPYRVARDIKGRGPHLTFGLKRVLSNLKMKPEMLELESTHPETLAIYTHTLKRSGCFFLLTQLWEKSHLWMQTLPHELRNTSLSTNRTHICQSPLSSSTNRTHY